MDKTEALAAAERARTDANTALDTACDLVRAGKIKEATPFIDASFDGFCEVAHFERIAMQPSIHKHNGMVTP